MLDVENSIPPVASRKLSPWYLCLMYVYAFCKKHFCMFNANEVFVLYYCLIRLTATIHKGMFNKINCNDSIKGRLIR